jgi:hypothetical protein
MVGAHGWPRRPPLRPIRFHPAGAACRGEAPPRPYFLVAYPHVIDGLGGGRERVASFEMASFTKRRCGLERPHVAKDTSTTGRVAANSLLGWTAGALFHLLADSRAQNHQPRKGPKIT